MQLLAFDLPGVAASLLTKTWRLQRTFNWQLMMPNAIGGILGHLVSTYCQDIKFGDYSFGELSTLRYGGFQRFYAGLPEIGTVTLSFISPADNTVYDYFKAWRNLIIDGNGYYHPKSEYKKEIQVFLYDRTGVYSAQFKLKGCFPKTSPQVVLSYNDEAIMKLEIELSMDYIKQETVNGIVGFLSSVIGGAAVGNVAGGAIGGIGGLIRL